MTNRPHSRRFVLRLLFLLLPFWLSPSIAVLAEDCFINKECVGVIEPYLIERECLLYENELKYRQDSEMRMVMPRMELDPDPLHAEFVKLVLEKKLISLKYATPIFSCGFNLERVSKDPEEVVETMRLPEFNCNGALSKYVPVMPVNLGICYWIDLENVECR